MGLLSEHRGRGGRNWAEGDLTLLPSLGTPLFQQSLSGPGSSGDLWLTDVQASKCWQQSRAVTGTAQASRRSFSPQQERRYHPKLSFPFPPKVSFLDVRKPIRILPKVSSIKIYLGSGSTASRGLEEGHVHSHDKYLSRTNRHQV